MKRLFRFDTPTGKKRQPRMRFPTEIKAGLQDREIRRKEGNGNLTPPPKGGDELDGFVSAKLKKEQALAEKSQHDAELRRLEIAKQHGDLLPVEDVRKQLELEHAQWLSAIDDWRQIIVKKVARLGIPVELQESITEMINKEITIMRQKRASNG